MAPPEVTTCRETTHMASQHHPRTIKNTTNSGKGLHRTALAQAEKLRVKDERAGRLAMMQIFAEMNDSWDSNAFRIRPKRGPRELVPFAIRALTFTGQKEKPHIGPKHFLNTQTTDDKKCGIICDVRRNGEIWTAKKIFNELGQIGRTEDSTGIPSCKPASHWPTKITQLP